MSERESEKGPAEADAVPGEPNSTPAVESARLPGGSSRGSGRASLWLAGLLILILAGVALSPFWAPQLEALLPWGENRDDYPALAARVSAVEARPVTPSNGIDAAQSAIFDRLSDSSFEKIWIEKLPLPRKTAGDDLRLRVVNCAAEQVVAAVF